MTSLPEFLNDEKCALSLVGCLPLKDVFRLPYLCPAVGSESIIKAFETDRAESVAIAKVAVELGFGEPVRHRGVGPNEIELSVKFANGVAVVPHDIMFYVPPKSPRGNAAAVELGDTQFYVKPSLCAAARAKKRKKGPAGRAAELTEDEFVRRVAGLVAPGARMTIPALEGAYEDEFKTAMIKDAVVFGQHNKKSIVKLVNSLAVHGVSTCQVTHAKKAGKDLTLTPLPSGWKTNWNFAKQKHSLRFFREE